MIWTTWRQHRAEALVFAGLVVAATAGLLAVGDRARTRAHGLGLAACLDRQGDCSSAIETLHRSFHSLPPFTGLLVALPLLAGMFWAAPLVSREYEAGTHRLAWTQSVSPLRWMLTKIALVFGVLATGALLLGLVAQWALDPLTPAFGGRYNSTWYDIQGIVPVACMVFALAAGVAASASIRRTLPAMAVTLVVYAMARIPVHWFRTGFAPLSTKTASIPLTSLLDNRPDMPLRETLTSLAVPFGSLTRGLSVTGPDGRQLSLNGGSLDVIQKYCPAAQFARGVGPNDPPSLLNPADCRSPLAHLSLTGKVSYQPASHFWIIQSVETLLFVGAAAALIALAVLLVTRRRSI